MAVPVSSGLHPASLVRAGLALDNATLNHVAPLCPQIILHCKKTLRLCHSFAWLLNSDQDVSITTDNSFGPHQRIALLLVPVTTVQDCCMGAADLYFPTGQSFQNLLLLFPMPLLDCFRLGLSRNLLLRAQSAHCQNLHSEGLLPCKSEKGSACTKMASEASKLI